VSAARGSRTVDTALVCPACDHAGLDVFYEQESIPAHSTLLLPSRESAVSYPQGTLRLGFCPACGFVTNTAFDVQLNEYSRLIEETQRYSPYFVKWLRGLADDFVNRFELHDKDVLEIGCGKGDFLAFVCEAGHNRGLGIDPSYIEGRLESPALDRMRFLNELYSEAHEPLVGDAIVCRHTLEHIGPVAEFVRTVRRSIGDRDDVVVFFELPETLRVLRECAFWDIYYEHCSYFTPGSLARLFRREGFDIVDVELDYADQYIVLYARPGTGTNRMLPIEDDFEATAAAVDEFRVAAPRRQAELAGLATAAHLSGRRPVIWGAGSKGVSLLTTLGLTEEIEYAVDVDPHKWGMFMAKTGQEIVGPDALRDYRPDIVFVMNPIYVDEIRGDLAARGLQPELVPV
jgi:SAM-dependent methyltransferase